MSLDTIKARNVGEAIYRQLRRNLGYYSKCVSDIRVENGRWVVKRWNGNVDVSELLK